MTLKPQCDCSTCACGNAPGRSGYCLNCEATDSGAEGSHAQHTPTPGPWYATTLTHDGETYSHVQSASINEDNYVARVDVMDEQGEANAALIAAAPETAVERDRLRQVNEAMLEALKAVVLAVANNPTGGPWEQVAAAIAAAEGE